MKKFFSYLLAMIMAFFGVAIPGRGTKDVISDGNIRIMSFNIRCGEFEEKRVETAATLIAQYYPDSIGVQECTYEWYRALTQLLPDYKLVGVGRDKGNRKRDCGEMAAVLFRKDKYRLLESDTFWISETPDEISFGWDAECRRVCTYVVLQNKNTGEKYAHINAHLDHMGALARENGVKMIAEKALSFDMPTALTGDLNFPKHSELYNQLTATGLVDSQDMAADTMTGNTFNAYGKVTDGEPIDFVMLNSRIESVSKYRIITDLPDGIYPSDHYPIYADITF